MAMDKKYIKNHLTVGDRGNFDKTWDGLPGQFTSLVDSSS